MEWKDSYSVGIQEIDEHHKHLLRLFARINDSIKLRRGWREIIYDTIDLKVFARRHFEFEEGLMRMYGYKESATHEKSHQHFFAKLLDIESKSIPELAQTELVKFLCDWLTNHILGEDQGYSSHILSGAPVVRAHSPTLSVVGQTA